MTCQNRNLPRVLNTLKIRKQNTGRPVGGIGPELKPFAKSCVGFKLQSNADYCVSPITGNAGCILLSIDLGCCILIAFLILKDFCQSVHTLNVKICSIY